MPRSIFDLDGPLGRQSDWTSREPGDDDAFVFNINRFQSPTSFNDETPATVVGGGLLGGIVDVEPSAPTGTSPLDGLIDGLPDGGGGGEPAYPYSSIVELIYLILGIPWPGDTGADDEGATDRGILGI